MSRRTAQVAGKNERRRKLARDAHQRRMERQAERARRAKQLSVAVIVAVLVVGVGIGSAIIAGAFSSKPAKAAANGGSSPPTARSGSAPVSPSATPSAAPSPSNTAAMVNGKCVYIKSGAAARKVKLPPTTPDTKVTYVATVKTNRGSIVIDLMNSTAPCTVGSFVSLASQGYYNNTHCHRLTTTGIYVLQCGDPTGTGSGRTRLRVRNREPDRGHVPGEDCRDGQDAGTQQ